MRRSHWLFLPFLVLGLTLAACDSAEPEPELGTVEGRVLAGNGETPVAGATVTLASAAVQRPAAGALLVQNAPSAVTDADGRFVLEDVPAGEQNLVARRGNFQYSFTVNVIANQTVSSPPVTLQPELPLAYISGSYDAMEEVVEAEGYSITQVSSGLFDDPAEAAGYGIIFLNCATNLSGSDEATITANTRAWLESGGTLYISDLSGSTANGILDGFEAGSGGTPSQTISAEVVFPDLISFLGGREEVEITYNLSNWYRIRELPATAVPLLRGMRSGQDEAEPLAVSIPVGQGRVVFTTFHNTANLSEDQRALLRYFIYLG